MAEQDAVEAVKSAYNYLLAVSPAGNSFSNFRLEEISLDDDGNHQITLSYEIPGEFGFDKKREYKDFLVDKDKKVVWMKIRKV